MRISGPERYELRISPTAFTVKCGKGTPRFSGGAASRKPKLYLVSINGVPIYVGITKQSMSTRLRLGRVANGDHGYYGYSWRHHYESATLDVWCHEDAVDRDCLDIETVEAEIVYLIRRSGQWPQFQTEIHFHPSKPIHREIAEQIMGHFNARR